MEGTEKVKSIEGGSKTVEDKFPASLPTGYANMVNIAVSPSEAYLTFFRVDPGIEGAEPDKPVKVPVARVAIPPSMLAKMGRDLQDWVKRIGVSLKPQEGKRDIK